MAYLIDTNIAIHARDGTESVLKRMAWHDGEILLSALSLAELQRGLHKPSSHAALRTVRFTALVSQIPVVPFDSAAAAAYGNIIAACGWVKGRDFDRMIAGHAISMRATLVTNNEVDFRDIPGLKTANWLAC